jgi:hypothetical protein
LRRDATYLPMGESTLFVVRVWQRDGFRASVRRVDDEDTRLFGAADELARYLEASARPDDAPFGRKGGGETK